MRRLLLLGGSAQQVIAIKKAKKLGYYTVLCDYLDDNPGQYVADKFYLISTTDKDAVLEVAIKEKVDGVIAFASDPAAPTSAYVAEKLGLSSNSYKSVNIMCDKSLFRQFLYENGFNFPVSMNVNENSIIEGFLKFPVIVKPVDSSGSKGISVINNQDEFLQAYYFALNYSRSESVIAEEFIVKDHQYIVGGDIFVKDRKIIVWGLLNCHRDTNVNSLVPVGKSFPLDISQNRVEIIKNELQKFVDAVGFENGEMNVEVIVDKDDKVFFIDIGPRAGGNMIPDLLSDIFGCDLISLSLVTSMGIPLDCKLSENGDEYYMTYNLHSNNDGVLTKISIDDCLKKYLYRSCMYNNIGDYVERFNNASKAIGILFFRFDSFNSFNHYTKNINNFIRVDVI